MTDNKIIEIKFNDKKEKVIILLKGNPPYALYESLLSLVESQSNKRVLLLPSKYVDEIKIIKSKK